MTLEQILAPALLEWAERSKLRTISVIRNNYLSGQVLKRRSGSLVRNVSAESSILSQQNGFEVGVTLNYGIMWELTGHRSYTIVPRRKKALKFKIGGKDVFSRKVTIPSAPARPYIAPAINSLDQYYRETAGDLISKALQKNLPNVVIKVI